VYFDS